MSINSKAFLDTLQEVLKDDHICPVGGLLERQDDKIVLVLPGGLTFVRSGKKKNIEADLVRDLVSFLATRVGDGEVYHRISE